jgi:DNA repair protein RecO (recombination protein O)
MYYQIKGLVLSAKTIKETDKTATIYSYQWGKVSIILPSAKKINAKLAAASEPLTESDFIVYQSHPSMRPKATGANIINNHSALKLDLKRNVYGLYAAEISEKLVAYNSPNEKKYALISRIWEILESSQNVPRALTAFVLRFLKLSGYGFSEYLIENAHLAPPDIEKDIKKLSKSHGCALDSFELDDERIWKYVESYLTNYMPKPSVGIFLDKLNIGS